MDAALHAALTRLGLKPTQLQQCLREHADALPFRISAVDRGLCTVQGFDAATQPVTRRVRPPEQAVTVGDWVLIDEADPPHVRAVLERTSVLRRGAVDKAGGQQLIAANLDIGFIVSAFAATAKLERRALQARRIERYAAALREGGALPVALLNKTDVSGHSDEDLRALTHELSRRLGHMDVLCVSAETGYGLTDVRRYLTSGTTIAFVGPSGVGKSSLINALLQQPTQEVAAVRLRDTKGRHTTTRRELVEMPDGALLIDTPGMREFAVVSESGELAGFDDIDALGSSCRFSNCQHDIEPGCAVTAAVARGELDPDRLQNFRALSQDAARLHAKHNALARREEHQRARKFGRMRRALEEKKR